ncbi:hypothetical protein KP509_25G017300 [Ceratopteris richardii]|nr:hypothetical protein KP509_25G017300 [Ceratopteris richardii]
MFAKCGALAKAREVFGKLPVRDAVSWTILVSTYAQYGYADEAIICFEKMQHEGLSPDGITLASILKAYGSIRAAERGKAIHAWIVLQGLSEVDIVIGNALVDMYSKCGLLAKAQQAFDELSYHDVISWNVLMTAYCQHGYGQKVLDCFERMKHDGHVPDAVTFAITLQACGSIGAAQRAEELHEEAVSRKLPITGIDFGNILVNMYAKCGALGKAVQVFIDLPYRDLISWGALLAGYCQHGHGKEALELFEGMKSEGLSPDEAIFISVLQACGIAGTVDKGDEIHAAIIKKGFLQGCSFLESSLIDMYSKCGAIANAWKIFNSITTRNLVCWNALITGYSQNGHDEEALNCFQLMQAEGLCPDEVTLACILKACGGTGAYKTGESLHVEIMRKGLLTQSIVLGNALVDMYAKCGALTRAQEVFNDIEVRNLVTWNALITGYCQHGLAEETLNQYECLLCAGLCPDTVTFVCILKACGTIGAVTKGHEIHAEIARKLLFAKSIMLGNALIDMYGKCGALLNAQQVFAELPIRDIVSWNALISGYSEHGHGSEALSCFEGMKQNGVSPDVVTFMSVLKACGSVGAAEEGRIYFEMMSLEYGIIPSIEHHTCMIGMFSYAGYMSHAMAILGKVSSSDYFPAWCTLLVACKKWANVELAEMAFKHATKLDENSAVPYVLLSDVYSAVGRQADADSIKILQAENRCN